MTDLLTVLREAQSENRRLRRTLRRIAKGRAHGKNGGRPRRVHAKTLRGWAHEALVDPFSADAASVVQEWAAETRLDVCPDEAADLLRAMSDAGLMLRDPKSP